MVVVPDSYPESAPQHILIAVLTIDDVSEIPN